MFGRGPAAALAPRSADAVNPSLEARRSPSGRSTPLTGAPGPRLTLEKPRPADVADPMPELGDHRPGNRHRWKRHQAVRTTSTWRRLTSSHGQQRPTTRTRH